MFSVLFVCGKFDGVGRFDFVCLFGYVMRYGS